MPPLTHDTALAKLRTLARSADRRAIVGAFVASLGARPGFWRAPLCALAAAMTVPHHRYRAINASDRSCAECGLLPTVELPELHERGQCLPGDLAEAIVLLTRAAHEDAPSPAPADAKRLAKIVATVGTLPATARESKLTAALRTQKLVTGDRYDVRSVIETLGALGVLQTPEHPGLATRWTSFAARQDRPSANVETAPPIAFWTVAHGVDVAQVKAWFGALGVKVPARAQPRPVPVAAASKRADARARRAARSTELAKGDVIAIPRGRRWFAAVVVGHHTDKGRRFPIFEVLDWKGARAPAIADLRGARAVGARIGRERRRDPVSLDLWVRDDPAGRWQHVAGTLPPPSSKHLGPPLGAFGVLRLGRDGSGLASLVRELAR